MHSGSRRTASAGTDPGRAGARRAPGVRPPSPAAAARSPGTGRSARRRAATARTGAPRAPPRRSGRSGPRPDRASPRPSARRPSRPASARSPRTGRSHPAAGCLSKDSDASPPRPGFSILAGEGSIDGSSDGSMTVWRTPVSGCPPSDVRLPCTDVRLPVPDVRLPKRPSCPVASRRCPVARCCRVTAGTNPSAARSPRRDDARSRSGRAPRDRNRSVEGGAPTGRTCGRCAPGSASRCLGRPRAPRGPAGRASASWAGRATRPKRMRGAPLGARCPAFHIALGHRHRERTGDPAHRLRCLSRFPTRNIGGAALTRSSTLSSLSLVPDRRCGASP
jgi:hypothetical protein